MIALTEKIIQLCPMIKDLLTEESIGGSGVKKATQREGNFTANETDNKTVNEILARLT